MCRRPHPHRLFAQSSTCGFTRTRHRRSVILLNGKWMRGSKNTAKRAPTFPRSSFKLLLTTGVTGKSGWGKERNQKEA
jgi:hypothetical protein